MSASVGKAAEIQHAFRPTVEVLSVRGLAERTGLPRLHRESGPTRVPMVNRVGMRAPAFLSGCGKSALAALDPVDADQPVRRLCRDEELPLSDAVSGAARVASRRLQVAGGGPSGSPPATVQHSRVRSLPL
ncbi:hypothetical protein [Pseudonocardia sp.]|uniref:hypothetical protein n=1 Tax=Pseudonocardia sp. TaxID=60912 RepID=UPI003D147FA7